MALMAKPTPYHAVFQGTRYYDTAFDDLVQDTDFADVAFTIPGSPIFLIGSPTQHSAIAVESEGGVFPDFLVWSGRSSWVEF